MNSALTGVDIGGTKILGVLVDAADPSAVVDEHRVPTPEGTDNVLNAIADVAKALGPSTDTLGVGIAGLVDRGGMLHVGPNLPGLHDVAVKDELQRRLGHPVAVDNDATCATWAEFQVGAAQGINDVVCITLGTGIGGGLVAGGEVVRGAHGFGGEVGHMVVDPNGPLCPCGRRGCWERLASGSGLARLAQEWATAGRLDRPLQLAGGDLASLRGEHVAMAMQEGDGQALALLKSFGWWLAIGIANLVTITDPGVVVVGGGLIEMGEPLVEPVREHYRRLVMSHAEREEVQILPAALGERAGAIGAALLGKARVT